MMLFILQSLVQTATELLVYKAYAPAKNIYIYVYIYIYTLLTIHCMCKLYQVK